MAANFFPNLDVVCEPTGAVENKLMNRLTQIDGFKFAPHDEEMGVAVFNYVLTNSKGVKLDVESLNSSDDLMLHGRIASWGTDGTFGVNVKNIGPLGTWYY